MSDKKKRGYFCCLLKLQNINRRGKSNYTDCFRYGLLDVLTSSHKFIVLYNGDGMHKVPLRWHFGLEEGNIINLEALFLICYP